MATRAMVLAVVCSTLMLSCADQRDGAGETQEIIDNLVQAGFPASDVMVAGGVVYQGRDAAVSLQASREMLQVDGSTTEEQYRTTNLVAPTLRVICINGAALASFTKLSQGLDLAIANYTNLNLIFNMSRRTTDFTGCSTVITVRVVSGTGASSGFPSGGLPFATINIGAGLNGPEFTLDQVECIITHELGHVLGLRHSDWFNTSFSCGTGGSEGTGTVGAILIPGTPSGATDSIMNACACRSGTTGELSLSDIAALLALYGL